jgi:hypothetical protein
VLRPGRGLASEKGPAVPIVQEAGWASELVWTYRLEEKTFSSAGDRTSVLQSVVRYYNDWATPAFVIRIIFVFFFHKTAIIPRYRTKTMALKNSNDKG